MGLPGSLAGKMIGMAYSSRLIYDLDRRRSLRRAYLETLPSSQRQTLLDEDAAKEKMVKLEAIIEVSQGLDNGSVPSKYIKNFDVLGETLVQKKQ